MAKVSPSTLQAYSRKVKWGKHKSMPMMPGEAIKFVIKHYKIPAKRWGYLPGSSIIGVETNKQQLFWMDKGGHLEFKGLLNIKTLKGGK